MGIFTILQVKYFSEEKHLSNRIYIHHDAIAYELGLC
jgi:hypothetical protein